MVGVQQETTNKTSINTTKYNTRMSVKRTILEAVPLPELPGYESRLVLLEYPPGVAAVPHTHPVVGTNYVVQGSVISAWEDGPEERFSAGQTFLDYAHKRHTTAVNASKTEDLKIVVSYMIKTGEANMHPL